MTAHALLRQMHVPVRNGLENGVVLAEAMAAEIRGQPVDPEAPPPVYSAIMLAIPGSDGEILYLIESVESPCITGNRDFAPEISAPFL